MSGRFIWLLFGCSLAIGLLFSVAPLPVPAPDWFAYLRPDWLLLVWFFWVVVRVQQCSLVLAFVLGLCTDVLLSQPLGLNALLLTSLTFIGAQALRYIQYRIKLNATVTLVILCFLFTLVESLVLFLAYDVEIEVINTLIPPLVTLAFWIPLIPLLTSRISQFNEEFE